MLVYVEHLSEMTNVPRFFPASSKEHLIHLEPLGKASQYQMPRYFTLCQGNQRIWANESL